MQPIDVVIIGSSLFGMAITAGGLIWRFSKLQHSLELKLTKLEKESQRQIFELKLQIQQLKNALCHSKEKEDTTSGIEETRYRQLLQKVQTQEKLLYHVERFLIKNTDYQDRRPTIPPQP